MRGTYYSTDYEKGSAVFVPQPRFYGADFTVEELVGMMERKQITVPQFQRGFVWTKENASRFIESILLGLPVVGIYFLESRGDDAYQIVDGHQRLRALTFFCQGYWPDGTDFALEGVDEDRLRGKTYDSLDSEDRSFLDNALIRTTIFRVESPNDLRLIAHFFAMQNTGGVSLSRQELQLAGLYGPLADLVRRLNNHVCWVELIKDYPTVDPDQLILRFLALTFEAPPKHSVSELISSFIKHNNDLTHLTAEQIEDRFSSTMCTIRDNLHSPAFTVRGKFHSLLFDAVTVGVAHRLMKGPIKNRQAFVTAYSQVRDSLIDQKTSLLKGISSRAVSKSIALGRKYFEAIQ